MQAASRRKATMGLLAARCPLRLPLPDQLLRCPLGFRRLLLRGADRRSRRSLRCLGACGSGSLLTGLQHSAKTKLLRERRAALRIGRRHHRISCRQAPFGSVRARRKTKSLQVALQHLHLRAVFQADQIVTLDRAVDRHRRLSWLSRYLACVSPTQGAEDAPDDAGQCVYSDRIFGGVRLDDSRRQSQQLRVIWRVRVTCHYQGSGWKRYQSPGGRVASMAAAGRWRSPVSARLQLHRSCLSPTGGRARGAPGPLAPACFLSATHAFTLGFRELPRVLLPLTQELQLKLPR